MSKYFEFAKFTSRISIDEEHEFKDRFGLGGIDECLKYLLQQEPVWKKIPLNVGVIGSSGVGKSTFINALRGLNGENEGAAAISVKETTMEPTPYLHPNKDNIKLWDLPGVGTLNFPRSDYLEKIEFIRYDFFIIITASRFTETDAWLAEQIKASGKQLYFVRTQIGVELEKDKKAHPTIHNAKNVENSIRSDVAENLSKLNVQGITAFFIDSYERDKYDFQHLENYILETYLIEKRQALINSVTKFSDEIVREKVQLLRKPGIRKKMLFMFCIIPVLSAIFYLKYIIDEVAHYFKVIGLNLETLQATACIISLNKEPVTKTMVDEISYSAAFARGQLRKEDIQIFVNPVTNQKKKMAMFIVTKELFCCVIFVLVFLCPHPVVWFLTISLSAILSYVLTDKILNHVLDKLENVALKIINVYIEKTF